MEIQHWCMFLGNKICVQILWLRKDHMQGVLLSGTALRLAWNLSSWEISLKLNFDSSSFFLFLFASLQCNTTKKKIKIFIDVWTILTKTKSEHMILIKLEETRDSLSKCSWVTKTNMILSNYDWYDFFWVNWVFGPYKYLQFCF